MKSIPGWKNLALLAVLASVLAGCATVPPGTLSLAPESDRNRERQTRHFDALGESDLLAAGTGVLQDLGFTLEESEGKLGVVTAARKLTSRRPLNAGEVVSKLAVAVVVPYLGGPLAAYSAVAGVKEPQIVRVSLVTRAAGSGATLRITAQRAVYVDERFTKTKSAEPLNDPRFYEEFFTRLEQSAFLEKQSHAS